MKSQIFPKAAVLAILAFGPICQGAVVVALYNFEDQDMLSNDLEATTSASILSVGPGIAGSLSGNTAQDTAGLEIHDQHSDSQAAQLLVFGGDIAGFGLVGRYEDFDPRSSSLSQAHIDQGVYLSFTIDLTPGQQLNLDTFSLDTDVNGGGAPKFVSLFSSIDGFAAPSNAIANDSFADNENITFNLAGLGTISSTTEFRIYFAHDASTASHGVALDNITLVGTPIEAAIPEPSALGLLACGALGLFVRRRR